MEQREETIRLWFDMWLKKQDLGIDRIFAEDAVYIESWGPQYNGAGEIKRWFDEWNERGTVLVWNILQVFHRENQTMAEWRFQNTMDGGEVESLDGVTLVEWTPEGKIQKLKEFGCKPDHYDPYQAE